MRNLKIGKLAEKVKAAAERGKSNDVYNSPMENPDSNKKWSKVRLGTGPVDSEIQFKTVNPPTENLPGYEGEDVKGKKKKKNKKKKKRVVVKKKQVIVDGVVTRTVTKDNDSKRVEKERGNKRIVKIKSNI